MACRILDLDPDLGSGVSAAEWENARRACVGSLSHPRPGDWEPGAENDEQGGRIGFLISDGIVCRELGLRDRHMFELLGPGDVVSPPVSGEQRRLSSSVKLTVAAETVVVALGQSFVRAAARWPCLLAAVLDRLEAQRERLALQGLIAHLPRAEDRMLLALWILADRWGRATPEGTSLPLALTHDLLGQLTASRRPTATVALSALEAGGAIRHYADGSWLLTEQAGRRVASLAKTSSAASRLGERFMLRQALLEIAQEAAAVRAEARQARA